MVFILVMGTISGKPSITEATRYDLMQVEYIGEVRADSILRYVAFNPDTVVDDLINVNGVGEVIVKKLRWLYE